MSALSSGKKRPVVSIWLDAFDRGWFEAWMQEKALPGFASMRERGAYARLKGFPHSLAEVTQSMAFTGHAPADAGYWGIHRWDPETYRLTERGSYDYERVKPYFALGDGYRVCAFDFPQFEFHEDIHGLQVRGWGAHSAMVPCESFPPERKDALVARYGVHPGTELIYAVLEDESGMMALLESCLEGVAFRRKLYTDLLAEESWDLFTGIFSEVHKAGHYFMPSDETKSLLRDHDPLWHVRKVFREIDRTCDALVRQFGDEMNFLFWSMEGFRANYDEVPNVFYLGEMLLRDSLGRGAFVFEEDQVPASPESQAGIKDWVMEAWNCRRRPSSWEQRMRAFVDPVKNPGLAAIMGVGPLPKHPSEIDYMEYQPCTWIQQYWPRMRAFALPTFSDGHVRINVKGRERWGMVAPEDFRRECDRVAQVLSEWKIAETGQPAVKECVITRDDPFATGDENPIADIIVLWSPECGKTILSDRLGQIGPTPTLRAGAHTPQGFVLGVGPDIAATKEPLEGGVLDLAPTVLSLMGAETEAVALPGSILPLMRTRVD